ncbi:MAG: class B sortase [Cellulosilyticaceae bacterium]
MRKQVLRMSFIAMASVCLIILGIRVWQSHEDKQKLHEVTAQLKDEKESSARQAQVIDPIVKEEKISEIEPQILPEYLRLYEMNQDLVGWLKIEDTRIDYPVMQTLEDEDYYLDKGFDGEKNSNGSLILDTSCQMGGPEGSPSTNLIIHGHHMRSGEMFGDLEKYMDADYAKLHERIQLDTLYEKREYQVVAVFLSQVYSKSDTCFKYYQFVEADTPEAFETFYNTIKELSVVDTGVTASYGDELLTLSTCSYHVEDGRLVVVAKRIV